MDVKLHGLTDNAVKTSVEVLNARVADGIKVARALKQAHWNVKGAGFMAFHELLDDIRDRVDGQVDELAERVQQLDGTAMGTVEVAARDSEMEPYPTDLVAVEDHVKAVTEMLRAFGGKLREGIDTTESAGDPNTADLLTAASNSVDKDTWFVASFTV